MICVAFRSPPKISAPATPGTERRLGRTVQVAIVRSCISDSFDDVNPITRTVAAEEVSGVIEGGSTPVGS